MCREVNDIRSSLESQKGCGAKKIFFGEIQLETNRVDKSTTPPLTECMMLRYGREETNKLLRWYLCFLLIEASHCSVLSKNHGPDHSSLPRLVYPTILS